MLKLEQYILEFGRIPQRNIDNKTIKKLSKWTACQKENYKAETQIMQEIEIRNIWKEFINKYPNIFKDKIDENYLNWYLNLNKLEKYIIDNNIAPSNSSKNNDIKQLYNWKSCQIQNYKKEIKIMKDPKIKKVWNDFTNKYKHLFMNNIEIWYDNISKLSNYIDEYNGLPSAASNDNNVRKLGHFISTQKKNYKDIKFIMKHEEICKAWEEFLHKYKEYNNLTN